MQTVRLDISSDIFDKVMFLLENLPKSKVRLKIENNIFTAPKEAFNPRDFFGVANSSKAEIDKYLIENSNEWDNYIDER
ncbi:MAG: hypothetical protein DRP93_08370 [Candidatus Neomarinimicrobiota bacterium]|nr:MAG: hypothetical protein DRP93_08370 [Candidatus Neomarinimicrobiota bacterium]